MALSCDALCDGPSARVLDHAMTRYTDRSSFANNAAMDGFNSMQFLFLAEAQNQMEKHGLADMLGQFLILPIMLGDRGINQPPSG